MATFLNGEAESELRRAVDRVLAAAATVVPELERLAQCDEESEYDEVIELRAAINDLEKAERLLHS